MLSQVGEGVGITVGKITGVVLVRKLLHETKRIKTISAHYIITIIIIVDSYIARISVTR